MSSDSKCSNLSTLNISLCQESVFIPSHNKKADQRAALHSSSLTFASCEKRLFKKYRDDDANSDLILSSDSINIEVYSSLPAQQSKWVRDYSY